MSLLNFRLILSVSLILSPGMTLAEKCAQDPAQFTGETTEDFCNKPFESICNYPFTGTQGRIMALNDQTSWAEDYAVQMAAGRGGVSVVNFYNYLQGLTPQKRQEVVIGIQKHIYTLLEPRFNKGSQVAVKQNIGKLKDLMNQTVDRLYPRTGIMENASATLLKKRIADVRVVVPSDLDTMKILNPPEGKEIEGQFAEGCGYSGLEINAFAYTSYSGQRFLIICPGWIISSSLSGGTSEGHIPYLLQVFAHEVGHHMDSSVYPNVFSNVLSCTLTNYIQRLKAPVPDPRFPLQALKIYTNEEIVQNHAREITADMWAREVVETHIRSMGPNASHFSKMMVLREAVGALCESGDEGIHTDGRHRIEVILGKSEGLRQAMGCKKKFHATPDCDFTGATLVY